MRELPRALTHVFRRGSIATERFDDVRYALLLLLFPLGLGCAHSRGQISTTTTENSAEETVAQAAPSESPREIVWADDSVQWKTDTNATQASSTDETLTDREPLRSEPTRQAVYIAANVGTVTPVADWNSTLQLELPPAPASRVTDAEAQLNLDRVIASVYEAYPSLNAAIHQRGIALGEQITAQGSFDTKFKAATENTPIGFYETYRNSVGVVQPLYQGGEFFAGYRIGRGSFEPWYLERQTNDAGEFKAGVVLPLAQDRSIDERRANLWRSQYERNVVEAEIQAQLIDFVQRASIAYWEWVAAGESNQIAEDILKLADDRTDRIRSQVDSGLLDPPELTDNLRLIAERQAKIAQTSRKLQRAAIKLSLYHRGINGEPIVPNRSQLPEFPDPVLIDASQLGVDAQMALSQRPELAMFDLVKRQLDIDYTQALNMTRPEVDAVLSTSKDMGEPTSPKNDKGPLVFDASVYVDVPLQRRKARGKLQSIMSKVSQLAAKRRLTENQIVADVQMAYAALITDYEQVQRAREAVELAEELAERERTNFEAGSSDLLKVTLREQYAVETRQKLVDALLDYYISQANYRAALALDRLDDSGVLLDRLPTDCPE